MARYVVMEPPESTDGREARIVADGFSWLGFIVAPVWLLWHRLWVEAIVVVALWVAIAVAAERLGHPVVGMVLSLLITFYIGMEGRSALLAALRRRGWREWGVVDARSLAEAEVRHAYQIAPPRAADISEKDSHDGSLSQLPWPSLSSRLGPA